MDYLRAKDPLTGQEFIKHRHNQKFATRANQIRFNNLKALRKRAAKAPLDRILDNNRTILNKILGNNTEEVVSRDYLLGTGYSLNYLQYKRTVTGIEYAGIYEYGIAKLSDGKYKIVKFNNG